MEALFLLAAANVSIGSATKCQDRSGSAWIRTLAGLQHSWGQRCLAELSLFGWLIINNQRIIFDFQPQPRTKLYRLQYSGEFLWESRCLERSLGVHVQAGRTRQDLRDTWLITFSNDTTLHLARCQVIGEAGGRIGDGLWSCHQCM